ncbi:MAG: HAD family hydrolase [Pseudomonadota bacterium]
MPASVLFDLDGTLLDTAVDFVVVLRQLAREADTTAPDTEQVHHTVSAGARALVTLTLGLQVADPGFDQWHQRLLTIYGEHITRSQARLYDGLEPVLRQLEREDIPWGVVTNKPDRFTQVLMRALSLYDRCAVTVCPEHVQHTKPHPEPLLLACRQLGCSASDSVYVGDHPRDIEAGNAAGMHTAVAAWGYLPAGADPIDWNAERILAHPEELPEWLNLNESQETK